MSNDNSQDIAALRRELAEEIDRVSSIISTQLGDVIANSRWYSTLVVGEIAGIAKFAASTHWWTTMFFLFSLLGLFVSIVCLVYSTVLAQASKYEVETKLAQLASCLGSVNSGNCSDIKNVVQLLYSVGEKNADPLALSRYGLWAFLIGSVFGGLALVFHS